MRLVPHTGAVLALLAVCSLPASAAGPSQGTGTLVSVSPGSGRLISVSDQTIHARMEGSLVVRFHGDPATGCDADGLCGYSGTITWVPVRGASVDVLKVRTIKRTDVSLNLTDGGYSPSGESGGTTNAVVQQSSPAGSSCADVATAGDDIGLPIVHDHVRFTLAHARLLQTRCAGPLDSDVASALPVVARTLAATLHGQTTISLAGSHRFASHGFAGTVTSTVKIHLGKPGRTHRQQGSGQISGKQKGVRVLEVEYAGRVHGGLTAMIRGDSIPSVCGPLGSCGAHGTIALESGSPRARVDVYAIGPARRPTGDFMTALGISHQGNKQGIYVFGAATWGRSGSQSSEIRQGSITCRDRVPGVSGYVVLAPIGGSPTPLLIPGVGPETLFRSRCPGPEATQTQLPGVFAPGRGLGKRTTVISFTRAQPLSDDGYTGTIKPQLTITLRRGKLHSHFEQVPAALPFSADLARVRLAIG